MNIPSATRPLRRSTQWTAATALFTVLCALGCKPNDFPEYPSNYREYAYIANQGGNTVTALDLVDLRLDRVIAVGQQPVALAINPAKTEVYVVNRQPQGTGSVSVLNAQTNSVAATIYVHRLPAAIAVDPVGKRAYVANSGANSISVLDLQNRREISTIATGQQPTNLRISPDGNTVVAANQGDGSISIYTVHGEKDDQRHPLELRATIAGCPGAGDLAILPDSTKVFVACTYGHQVMSVALAQPATSTTAATHDALLVMLDVGKTPVQLAMKPDGGEIFVSDHDSDSISEIATGADEVGGTYFIGSKPSYGLVSTDNATLWVSNFGSDTVTAYSIDDGRIDATVRTGMAPSALAFTSAGNLLLAIDTRSGDVSLIRTLAHDSYVGRSLFTLLPAGPQPAAIAVKSFILK